MALNKAREDIRSGRIMQVPEHLRNVHVKSIGKDAFDDYKYPHDYENHFTAQDYLPIDCEYYTPTKMGYEDTISKRMEWWKQQKSKQG
jgi:putative ATPase